MKQIHINLVKEIDHSYDIFIESGLLAKIPTLIKEKPVGNKYCVISDDTVASLYAENFVRALRDLGIDCKLLTFKPGDASKSLETLEEIISNMIGHGFDRKDAIITMGGGVTGDLGGFAASIYMRGIPFIQIPTTLVSMVDSSVGGKTMVNIKAGKNLAGRFHQPASVYIDPDLLNTLPEEEFMSGMSEVLKYGVIYDAVFFDYIEKNQNNLRAPEVIGTFIIESCRIKGDVVEKDEQESKLRMILNYGHTIGHALETISNYKINHGQGVALGMTLINNIASNKGILSTHDASRINKLIRDLNLIGTPARNYCIEKNSDKIWSIMLTDKKTTSGKINFIVPSKIGKVTITTEISHDDVKQAIREYASSQ